jgi:hypothetical protein
MIVKTKQILRSVDYSRSSTFVVKSILLLGIIEFLSLDYSIYLLYLTCCNPKGIVIVR